MKDTYNSIQQQTSEEKTFHEFSLLLILLLFISLSSSSKAQVHYTDITPDVEFQINNDIDIDINNDGEVDFLLRLEINVIYEVSRYHYKIITTNPSQVAITNDSASALMKGDIINENLFWSNNNEIYIQHVSYHYEGFIGNWTDIDKGFLGLRTKINDEYHYSWLRLHFDAEYSSSMSAVDYAYNENPSNDITAGNSLPTGATSVFAADKSDFFDGRDIKVSFTKAFDESIFTEYRIVLAKADDTLANNLEFMNALSNEKYFSVLVDESSAFIREIDLTEETVDIDGDLVDKFIDYRIHILNVAASGNPIDNILSTCSRVINLQAYTQKANILSAMDIANTNTAEDILVSITAIEDELFLSEYRIFIAPLDDTLDIETALSLSSDYYTSVIPNDSLITTTLQTNQTDINRNPITGNTFYQIYILSVADSIFSVTSAISSPSRRFVLNDPNYFTAGQKTGDHILSYKCDSLFCEYPFWTGEESYSEAETYIDVNRDGVPDFYLYGKEYGTHMYYMHNLYLIGEGENKVLICNHEEHENWIDVLNENDAIGDRYKWHADSAILTDYNINYWDGTSHSYGHLANYNSLKEYYIGFLIFVHNDMKQYAWLKMKNHEFIEYGYQNIVGATNALPNEKYFHIYPNPTSNHINIKSSDNFNSSNKISLSIINSMGQVIEEVNDLQSDQTQNISYYPAGLYFFVIKDGEIVLETHRVIIE